MINNTNWNWFVKFELKNKRWEGLENSLNVIEVLRDFVRKGCYGDQSSSRKFILLSVTRHLESSQSYDLTTHFDWWIKMSLNLFWRHALIRIFFFWAARQKMIFRRKECKKSNETPTPAATITITMTNNSNNRTDSNAHQAGHYS